MKSRLPTIVAVLLVILIIGVAGLAYLAGRGSQTVVIEKVTAVPIQPTATPTHTYINGLASTNSNVFTNAFADALAEQDVQNIEINTDIQRFILDCQSEYTLPTPGMDCSLNWKNTYTQLSNDDLEFSIPPDATLSTTPIPSTCVGNPNNPGNFTVAGTYDNKGSMLPLSHIGRALFTFACVTCGSETTWAWNSVYLC
jgi:hypothetical protein